MSCYTSTPGEATVLLERNLAVRLRDTIDRKLEGVVFDGFEPPRC